MENFEEILDSYQLGTLTDLLLGYENDHDTVEIINNATNGVASSIGEDFINYLNDYISIDELLDTEELGHLPEYEAYLYIAGKYFIDYVLYDVAEDFGVRDEFEMFVIENKQIACLLATEVALEYGYFTGKEFADVYSN